MNRPFSISPTRAATLALIVTLSGCSSVESFLAGDKVDYRAAATKSAPLEVPPDLTQLQRDSRYQPQGGVISASGFSSAASGAAAATGVQSVAPQQVGSVRIERQGDQRWLVTSQTPEQVWPELRAFWAERGFNVAVDAPEAGVMETDWAENRANLPKDFLRSMLGKVLDSVYDTGLRDKYRTRLERTPQGTEITISHQGYEEVVTGNPVKDSGSTIWRRRPADPALEGEMLARLMAKLGTKEEAARAAVAAATPASGAAPLAPAHARVLSGQPAAALQFDEPFDRAWRRVGLALDRSGFTVEDRDRASGVYFVRYADPKLAGKEEPGFFARLFSGQKKPDKTLARYRIELKRGTGDATTISVLDSNGKPDNSEVSQHIVALLVDDLK